MKKIITIYKTLLLIIESCFLYLGLIYGICPDSEGNVLHAQHQEKISNDTKVNSLQEPVQSKTNLATINQEKNNFLSIFHNFFSLIICIFKQIFKPILKTVFDESKVSIDVKKKASVVEKVAISEEEEFQKVQDVVTENADLIDSNSEKSTNLEPSNISDAQINTPVLPNIETENIVVNTIIKEQAPLETQVEAIASEIAQNEQVTAEKSLSEAATAAPSAIEKNCESANSTQNEENSPKSSTSESCCKSSTSSSSSSFSASPSSSSGSSYSSYSSTNVSTSSASHVSISIKPTPVPVSAPITPVPTNRGPIDANLLHSWKNLTTATAKSFTSFRDGVLFNGNKEFQGLVCSKVGSSLQIDFSRFNLFKTAIDTNNLDENAEKLKNLLNFTMSCIANLNIDQFQLIINPGESKAIVHVYSEYPKGQSFGNRRQQNVPGGDDLTKKMSAFFKGDDIVTEYLGYENQYQNDNGIGIVTTWARYNNNKFEQMHPIKLILKASDHQSYRKNNGAGFQIDSPDPADFKKDIMEMFYNWNDEQMTNYCRGIIRFMMRTKIDLINDLTFYLKWNRGRQRGSQSQDYNHLQIISSNSVLHQILYDYYTKKNGTEEQQNMNIQQIKNKINKDITDLVVSLFDLLPQQENVLVVEDVEAVALEVENRVIIKSQKSSKKSKKDSKRKQKFKKTNGNLQRKNKRRKKIKF